MQLGIMKGLAELVLRGVGPDCATQLFKLIANLIEFSSYYPSQLLIVMGLVNSFQQLPGGISKGLNGIEVESHEIP